jgi:hypothetical protein
VVALTAGRATWQNVWREAGLGWVAGAVLAIAFGVGIRLAGGGVGAGERSAAVMIALLSLPVWLATALLSTPRRAFLIVLGLVALLDFAGLPAWNVPEYDDREAFYRTDQAFTARVAIATALSGPTLTLLVEPVSASASGQAAIGLAGDVGNATLAWSCPFQRGMQRLALPIPLAAIAGKDEVDVRLHLTGSPRREGDYLLVYASSRKRGFLMSMVSAANVEQNATSCTSG